MALSHFSAQHFRAEHFYVLSHYGEEPTTDVFEIGGGTIKELYAIPILSDLYELIRRTS